MGLSAPFHENDYVWNRDPFAKHSIPSLFSRRMERASRVTLHLGAPGDDAMLFLEVAYLM